jgi:hypothetical protein
VATFPARIRRFLPVASRSRNFAMTGADALPGATLDRTREGYIEVFEMANLTGTAASNVTHPLTLVPRRPARTRSCRTSIRA